MRRYRCKVCGGPLREVQLHTLLVHDNREGWYAGRQADHDPVPVRAVWSTLSATLDDPVHYVGRVLDADDREVTRCDHRHATRDEAQACGEALIDGGTGR